MAWDKDTPASGTTPSGSIQAVLDNWDWLQCTLSAEHTFPGTLGSTAGKHLSGECGVVKYDTYANIDALSDIEHSLAYATDKNSFYTNNGAGWDERGAFPSETKAYWYQATAPAGWTIVNGYDDCAVTITSGGAGKDVGGTLSGSWNLSGLSRAHTHTYTEIPTHSHTCYGNDGGPDAGIYIRIHERITAYVYMWTNLYGLATCTTQSSTATLTGDATWRPAYAAVILCSKD